MNLDTQDQVEDKTVDRKELLKQQFDEAASEQPVAAKSQPVDDVAKAEEPVWKRPPSSWKRDYHEVWQGADPRLQEYAYQREEEMRAGIEPLRSKAKFAQEIEQAIEPYRNTINGLGIDAPQAIKALMEADHSLRYSAPDQKRAYLHHLARQYGIDLGNTGGYIPSGPIDPVIYQLQNQLNSVRGEVTSFKQQQEQAEASVLQQEIDSFAKKADYFEEARPDMIKLLQGGMATDLEDAYNKALKLNDELSGKIEAGLQATAESLKRDKANRAAKAAKAAAVSVRSSTPGATTSTKAQDRRSMLLEQFDSIAERF